MKCIGGGVDIQVGSSKKWVKRKLWINQTADGTIYTVYVLGRIRRGYWFLRGDGTMLNGSRHWRHIKLAEGYEFYKPHSDRLVRVRDIVADTKQRLGVE